MELDVNSLPVIGLYTIGLTSFLALLALRRIIQIILRCICPPSLLVYRLSICGRPRRRISHCAVTYLAYRGPFCHRRSVDTNTRAHLLMR
jgi:hypothetical protein